MMFIKIAFLPIVFGIVLWYASTHFYKHSSLQSVKLNDTYDYVIGKLLNHFVFIYLKVHRKVSLGK